MDIYHQDIFYDIEEKSQKQIDSILKECYDLSYNSWVDILDCSKSFCREKIDMSFDEVMELKKTTGRPYYVFIHRRGYEKWKTNDFFKWQLEAGFRLMEKKVDHFLWINCKEECIQPLVSKYKLRQR